MSLGYDEVDAPASARLRTRANRGPAMTPPPTDIEAAADPQPDQAEADPSQLFPIVGVGASAGGLHALGDFLKHLPINTGMGFVLIQHLAPDHPSQLTALLQPNTRLPLIEVINDVEVRPDHVYIIGPNTTLTLVNGVLHVAPREGGQPHFSIDLFLRSLAVARPGRAIGVVLTGTGSDGTLGLSAIKAAGGITFAHDDSAEHSAMPLNAINHGCVDFVLSTRDIARELGKIGRNGFPEPAPDSAQPAEEDGSEEDSLGGADPGAEEFADLSRILAPLHNASGIDFTHYRPTTIRRRIGRRMHMHSLATLAEYEAFLVKSPEEIAALIKDILINVSSFFRDRAVFQTLETTYFPALIASHGPDEPIRIWVIGCATGQEAYSYAIGLLELMTSGQPHRPLQIFATDISDWSLAKARAGWYPQSIEADVPADRLKRYFTHDGLGYRVTKQVRDLCVFAKHDITEEVPYGRMDVVSCRNVLIYLGPVLQRKVFPTIHFALKPNGLLVLGTSESIGRFANLFESVDERQRLYRRSLSPQRTLALPSINRGRQMMSSPDPVAAPSTSELLRAADRIVLGRYSPAGVLVNGAMDIIQYRGHTSPYLEPASGDASLNLLTMVPFAVGEALRQALEEAKRHNIPVRRQRISHRRDQTVREIAFEVVPVRIPPAPAETFLILFEEDAKESGPSAAVTPPTGLPVAEDSAESRELVQLRYELAAATDYIHSLIEKGDDLADQLKVSQEEASSTSEEFRSTNEELQTTKEEVESTNEELITINEELRNANSDLAKASIDFNQQGKLNGAIVETMRYPLLVLDGGLRVVLANPAFYQDFRVLPQDTRGRLVYELGNGQWDIPELRRLLETILPNDSAFDDFEVSREFAGIGRRDMLLNARRLLGADSKTSLVVLVIADITERNRMVKDLKDTTTDLKRSNAELEQFAAVASHDLQEPLSTISGFVGLFQRRQGEKMDEQGQECLRQITSGAQRMSEMIRAILAFSRLGQHAPIEALDSGKALRSALANLNRKIEAAGAKVTIDPLPRVMANALLLTQVFQNLISNGVKFRSEDRPATIHVSAVESGPEVTFAIADNGIGIAEADFARAFHLFHRLNPSTAYSGAGIGLATCKKIVEHHGGRIWIESRPDVGTTFSFTLPRAG